MKKLLPVFLLFVLNLCSNYNSDTKGLSFEQRSINAGNVTSFIKENQPIIIDVRTESEYNSEHLENAINIPYDDNTFELKINTLEKNKFYLVHCGAGVINGRSFNALKKMDQIGFQKVYNLEGGLNEWKKYKSKNSR